MIFNKIIVKTLKFAILAIYAIFAFIPSSNFSKVALSVPKASAADGINYKFAFSAFIRQSGVPLTGTHQLSIQIFNASTSGTTLFSQPTTSVTFNEGFMTVLVGPYQHDLFTDSQRFLEFNIDGITLSPRLEIAGSPYASNSSNLVSDTTNGINVKSLQGVRFLPYASSTGSNTELQFFEQDSNGTNYFGFKAPDNLSTTTVLILPSTTPAIGEALTFGGGNQLIWTNPATSPTSINVSLATTTNLSFDSATGTGLVVVGSANVSGITNLNTTTVSALTLTGLATAQSGIVLASATPATTAQAMYALGSTIYWNNQALALASSTLSSASNGLTATGTTVQLGGSLIQGTNINLNGQSLTIGSTTFASNGFIGIGTTNPTTLLTLQSISGQDAGLLLNNTDVNGATNPYISFQEGGITKHVIYVDSDDSDKMKIYNAGTGLSAVTINSAGYVGITNDTPLGIFHVKGAGDVIFENSSNVGIGTTTPAAKLTVTGTSIQRNIFPETTLTYALGASTTRWSELWAGVANIGSSTWSISQPSNGRFAITNQPNGAGSEYLTISNTGNIGIGTSNPTTLLHIRGAATELVNIETSGNDTAALQLTSASGKRWSMNVAGSGNTDGISNNTFYIKEMGIDNRFIINSANAGLNGGLTVGNAYYQTTAPANGLAIQGNLGIGTTTPAGKLMVQGSGSDIVQLADSAGSVKGVFSNNGFLGIGTTNPTYPLDVQSAGAAELRIKSSGSFTSLILEGAAGQANYIQSPYHLNFFVNGTTKMQITNTGDVKIGTTTPTGKFAVQGSGLDIAQFYASSGVQVAVINSNGNLAIGTTTAASKLHLQQSSNSSSEIMRLNNSAAGGVQTGSYLSFFVQDVTEQARIKVIGDAGGQNIGNIQLNPFYVGSEKSGIAISAISSGATVGINTTNTVSTLTAKAAYANQSVFSVLNNSGVEQATIKDSGFLGLGTTTPTEKLEIVGGNLQLGNNQSLKFRNTAGTAQNVLTMSSGDLVQLAGGSAGLALIGGATNQIYFAPAGVSNAVMASTYFSLGTTSTSGARFLVQGTGSDIFQALDSTGTGRMYLTNSGNLGIGTSSPTSKLHIQNSAELISTLSNSTATNNQSWYTAIGHGANFANGFFVIGTSTVPSPSNAMLRLVGDGTMYLGNSTYGGIIQSGSNSLIFKANSLSTSASNNIAYNFGNGASGDTLDATSGNQTNISIHNTFSPTSGNANYFALSITPTIVQTGGASGISRGIYLNPTLTSATDFRAIEVTNGNVLLGSTSGNLGLGVTNPGYKLTVKVTNPDEGISLQGPGAIVAQITDGNVNDGRLTLWSDNVKKVHIDSVGQNFIGGPLTIGTTTYSSLAGFEVQGCSGCDISRFYNSVGSQVAVIRGTGNFGIGTSTPGQKLVVAGAILADSAFYVGTSTGTSGGNENVIRPTLSSAFLNLKGGAGLSKIFIGNNNLGLIAGTGSGMAFNFGATSDTNAGTRYAAFSPLGTLALGATYSGLSSVTASLIAEGDVGIGTTSPIARFSVLGYGTTSGTGFIFADASSTPKFVILDNGNVGISSTTPGVPLAVTGNAVISGNLTVGSCTGCGGGGSLTGTAGQIAYFSGVNTAVGTSTIFLAPDGKFGVGTTTPGQKLAVSGSSLFGGHIAVGSKGEVDNDILGYDCPGCTMSFIQMNAETFTDLSAADELGGIQNSIEIDSTTNGSTGVYGIGNYVNTKAGNTANMFGVVNGIYNSAVHGGDGTLNTAQGMYGTAKNMGGGTVSNLIAAKVQVENDGGNVTKGYGLYVDSASNGAGTFASNYGIWIQDQSSVGSTNSYNLYSNGANSKNYFAGRVGIGTSSPQNKLDVSRTGAGVVASFTDADGSCEIDPTNTALSCTSDASLKKNVDSLRNGVLDKVLGLRPVSYHWLTEESSEAKHEGFIAQEVETLFPTLVSTNSSGKKSLNYSGLTPYLAKAIQELSAKVDLLSVTGNLVSQDQELIVKTHVTFSGDTVGFAKVKPGDKSVKISFDKPYASLPVVALTRLGKAENQFIFTVSTTTTAFFEISISETQVEDVTFSWHAFGQTEAKLFVSDGTIENVDLLFSNPASQSLIVEPVIISSPETVVPSSSPPSTEVEPVVETNTSTSAEEVPQVTTAEQEQVATIQE